MDELLPNERYALERRAYYESIGLVVDATNGIFCHCPYPKGMGDSGYYLLHDDHQHQGILQSKDVGELCFWFGDAKKWLQECDPIPDNYFELWDIYDEYAGENARKMNEKLHEEKDENGKSKHAVKAGKKSMEEKDEFGRSLYALKLHEEKDEEGKSKHALKMSRFASMKCQRMVELIRISDREVFVFESIKFGAEILGICASNIASVCKGKRKKVGGYTARYLD